MRCEFTDLEQEHCAHCKGKIDPDVEAVDPLEGVRLADKHDDHLPRAFIATFPGTCLMSGDPIAPGEFIVGVLRDPDSWSGGFKGYRHEECG